MPPQKTFALDTKFSIARPHLQLANFADVPEIEVILMDMPERGVIGVGEPATIPTAGAIANAVANALGVRVSSLPMTPARVLAALGKVKKPGASA